MIIFNPQLMKKVKLQQSRDINIVVLSMEIVLDDMLSFRQAMKYNEDDNKIGIHQKNEEQLKWRRYNNMKIEGNQKELDAMVEFHKGNRVEGLRLQEEFAAEFRKEYKDKDHCPCLKACRYHGNCKECVAIHRAHQEHVPNCMRPLINKKLKLMSELTEHTLANEIEAPHEILRKQASQIQVC